MSILFETMNIKGMTLRNRFVRSATYDGCAERSGQVSEKQMKLFTDLAERCSWCGARKAADRAGYYHPRAIDGVRLGLY